jgi:hypothetical protein
MNLANIDHFDSVRAYWDLLQTAEPSALLWTFLRQNGVDCLHIFNLLGGAVALRQWDFGRGKEDAVLIPCMDEDGVTPRDVVAFSLANPARFTTVLGIDAMLGAGEVMNPASYWAGSMCSLVRTPLQWLAAGIEFHACVIDAKRAKPIFDWAPGNVATADLDHAEELLATGVIDEKRLFIPNPRAAAA